MSCSIYIPKEAGFPHYSCTVLSPPLPPSPGLSNQYLSAWTQYLMFSGVSASRLRVICCWVMGWKATRLKPQLRWWFLGTPLKMTSVISVTWREGGRGRGEGNEWGEREKERKRERERERERDREREKV